MAKKQRRPREPFVLPAELVPDFDDWGSPAEERKRARRDEWLRENDLSEQYFFQWVPAHAAERRRLAGIPPRPPARRKGKLPEGVLRILKGLGESDEAPQTNHERKHDGR